MTLRSEDLSARQPAYYFLSYAHGREEAAEQAEAEHPGLVGRFKRDLDAAVRARVGRSAAASEREHGVGADRRRPAEALADCRSFVALCSSAYFDSAACGREWAVFTDRARQILAADVAPLAAVVPVLWEPVEIGALPEAAAGLDFPDPTGHGAYWGLGLKYLMTHGELSEDYRRVVADAAERVVHAAEHAAPPPAEPGWEPGAPAFGGQPTRGPRLRIVVAALHGADADPPGPGYGRASRDWRPYLPDHEATAAGVAQGVAASLGFRAFVEDAERCPELDAPAPATAPTVLLVDPRAPEDADLRRILSGFDRAEPPKTWIRLVVPCRRTGPDAMSGPRGLLGEALERTLNRCRRETPRAADGLESVEELIDELPDVMRLAEQRYLAGLSAGSGVGRPRPRLRFSPFPQQAARPGRGPADGPIDSTAPGRETGRE